MRTLIVNHLLVSLLLGMGAAYGFAYLVLGPTGVFWLAIVVGVCSFAGSVFWIEKLGADLRKDRADREKAA